jgi:hypothetical protein
MREHGCLGVGRHERINESPVLHVEHAQAFDNGREAAPGVRVCATVRDNLAACTQFVRKRIVDERLLRRKPSVEGRRTHFGAARYLSHRDLKAALGEQGAGGVQDPVAVLLRIRAKVVSHFFSHRSHFR